MTRCIISGKKTVLALGIQHARKALDAQSAVTEMTNEMFKQNATTLKQGAKRRAEVQQEMAKIEDELKTALIEAGNR